MTWKHWIGVPFRLVFCCLLKPFDILLSPEAPVKGLGWNFVKYGLTDKGKETPLGQE